MPPVIDPFKATGYDLAELSKALELVPYTPSRISQMGLFEPEGVSTSTIMLEEMQGRLMLLKSAPRGAPGQPVGADRRKIRSVAIPHFPVEEYVSAESVQGIREFGSPSAAQTFENAVLRKLRQIRRAIELTWEWMRMGALHGIVYDGDTTTVIANLFTLFEIQQVSVDFKLGTSTTDIRSKCIEVLRAVDEGLGDGAYEHVHAFCGSTFFDRLVGHADTKESFKYQEGMKNRSDVRRGFIYGDIVFEEYRGKVGGKPFVNKEECRFFPVGVAGLYTNYFAPAHYKETVNTVGQPMYAKQIPRPDNSGDDIQAQTNPLPIVNRPAVLIRGHTSN